jgi:hypothetical protein
MFGLGVSFRSNSVETVLLYIMIYFYLVDGKTYVNFNLQFMLHVTINSWVYQSFSLHMV